MLKSFLSIVTRHWISLVGAVIALVGAVLIVMFFAMQLSGFHGGPYLGILTYLILPIVLVVGLLLIPLGAHRRRRQEAAAAAHQGPAPRLPIIDLNDNHTRGIVLASVAIGLVSTVIVAGATYKGVEVMESVPFCGTVCHTVMQPEYTAFQRSSHSRLRCADCHIGAGADWFVKSKISGSWQLVSVAFNLYPRPIPSPVHSLRPARETCEECHWPTKFVGDKLVIHTNFAPDEKNSETKTVLLMKVGGQDGTTSTGIHWHVGQGVRIRYQSDPSRQTIYDVELTHPDGKVQIFRSKDRPAGPAAWRAGIAHEVETFYKTSYPDLAASQAGAIAAAGKALGDIYAWNVFPRMKVTWGTYPVNIGHEDSPGCMRCHDRHHLTADGEKITSSCSACHAVLADDEADPPILKELKP
jgi:hypothetical protein